MPSYWVSEIEKINNDESELRQNYDTLKNQFDIIMQDASTCFDISETNFVKYRSLEKIIEQGTSLRLEFTDTVDEIRQKIRSHLGIHGAANLEMIEV